MSKKNKKRNKKILRKVCPHCGKKLPDRFNVCSICGYSFYNGDEKDVADG